MKNLERLSLAEMKEFVSTNRQVGWSAVEAGAVYGLIERVLKAHARPDSSMHRSLQRSGRKCDQAQLQAPQLPAPATVRYIW